MSINNKTIYILGANGVIGNHLAGYFSGQGYRVFTERIDITDLRALKKAFEDSKPEVVLNCAGVRAYPNIDWCEDHKEETMRVNVAGANKKKKKTQKKKKKKKNKKKKKKNQKNKKINKKK